MVKVIVGAIQMEITGDRERNLQRATELLRQAAQAGCQLACLPEYFLHDCPEKDMTHDEVSRTAEPIPGPAIEVLSDVARRSGMYVCTGSFLERTENGTLRNTSCLIDPRGRVVGTYAKTHPENAPPKYEVGWGVQPGSDYPVFDTELGKVGIIIDMDATAAEAPRILYVRGAEFILWPLNWSSRWFRVVDVLPAAHAIMNKVYFVTANRVGLRSSRHGVFLYNGGSRVTNPEGFDIARAEDFREGVVVAACDLDLLREWRKTIIPRDYPYRRRPETYTDIVQPWSP